MTFKTWADLEKYVQKACRAAVDDTVAYFLEILQVHMEVDFYNEVIPKYYKRSMQFYNSAVMQMVKGKANEILGKVYMNPKLMRHIGNSYTGNYTGQHQLQNAAQGIHGDYYHTDTSYWNNFLEEFNKDVEDVLLFNMAAHGLPIKKA